jgi:hypothetical protein
MSFSGKRLLFGETGSSFLLLTFAGGSFVAGVL